MTQSSLDTRDGVFQALSDFYNHYVVTTAHGSFQVFQSFTYGEMTICLLLFSILLIYIFHWVYEVTR